MRPLKPAHMCVLHWLFIHALRHGQFEDANTLEEALELASRRHDQEVQWANPDDPIICMIKGKEPRLELKSPANHNQINRTIQEMSKVAGLFIISSHTIYDSGGLVILLK